MAYRSGTKAAVNMSKFDQEHKATFCLRSLCRDLGTTGGTSYCMVIMAVSQVQQRYMKMRCEHQKATSGASEVDAPGTLVYCSWPCSVARLQGRLADGAADISSLPVGALSPGACSVSVCARSGRMSNPCSLHRWQQLACSFVSVGTLCHSRD